ncbi:MAG: CPXCG motif-containing cysteine-rich protein [Chthoniobacterales bacterium]
MNFLCEEEVTCPYCCENFSLTVDTSQGDQTTTEDCTVCCRPIEFQIEATPGEVLSIQIARG